MVGAGSAWGGLITVEKVDIVNPGFEADINANPVSYTPGITGWDTLGDFNNPPRGTINPGPTGFTLGVSVEGANVAYSNGGEIAQVLPSVLRPNGDYILRVNVGRRDGSSGFAGYAVRLLAGDTVLAEESSLTPVVGQMLTSVVMYDPDASDPLLGEPLKIVLWSAGSQASFDNVRLHALGAPLPETVVLCFMALGALTMAKPKRR